MLSSIEQLKQKLRDQKGELTEELGTETEKHINELREKLDRANAQLKQVCVCMCVYVYVERSGGGGGGRL